MSVQWRRGDTAANDAYTGPVGSFTVDTELNSIRIHDGVTPGGVTIPNAGDITSALSDHEAEADPHDQYAELSGGADANFSIVPRVGGDAIVNSGSNGNGNWTRYSDGTQICRFSGGVAGSDTVWTFPAVFNSAPQVTGIVNAAGAARILTRGSISSTTVALYVRDLSGALSSNVVDAVAIGSWK